MIKIFEVLGVGVRDRGRLTVIALGLLGELGKEYESITIGGSHGRQLGFWDGLINCLVMGVRTARREFKVKKAVKKFDGGRKPNLWLLSPAVFENRFIGCPLSFVSQLHKKSNQKREKTTSTCAC